MPIGKRIREALDSTPLYEKIIVGIVLASLSFVSKAGRAAGAFLIFNPNGRVILGTAAGVIATVAVMLTRRNRRNVWSLATRRGNQLTPERTKVEIVFPRGGPSRSAIIPNLGGTQITWDSFSDGLQNILSQTKSLKWHPDVIVGINSGGIAIADLLGATQSVPTAVAIVNSTRQLELLALPKVSIPRPHAKVLLVDWCMKTGSVLDVIAQKLADDGFDRANILAAVLILATVGINPKNERVVLRREDVTPMARERPSYSYWLERLVLIGFVSQHEPLPPWRVE